MINILVAGGIALVVSILSTPFLIVYFARKGFGQEIRVDGPASHQAKRGTPTMGGVAIITGMWAGYLGTHLVGIGGVGTSASALLILGLATALGFVGFLDDFIKIRRKRNLGLKATGKYVGQIGAALVFAILALQFRNGNGLTPGSVDLELVRRSTFFTMVPIVFVLFCIFLVVAWSNTVNLTDGLDGLAAGSMIFVLGAYTVMTFWQYRHSCALNAVSGCYQVRDSLDLAVVCAAAGGSCIGFLWWNAAPARIFMGDTGSLALGGLLAGLSIVSKTELIAVVIGALFVIEGASVIIQVGSFKSTGKRPFRIAPIHHHYELAGWAETTVLIRFWLFVAITSALGIALFYGEFLAAVV